MCALPDDNMLGLVYLFGMFKMCFHVFVDPFLLKFDTCGSWSIGSIIGFGILCSIQIEQEVADSRLSEHRVYFL